MTEEVVSAPGGEGGSVTVFKEEIKVCVCLKCVCECVCVCVCVCMCVCWVREVRTMRNLGPLMW